MTLYTKQKQTHRQKKNRSRLIERKQNYGYQRRGGEGQIRSMRITYKLLYVKEISNKDLLYSTENYIQYIIISYNKL